MVAVWLEREMRSIWVVGERDEKQMGSWRERDTRNRQRKEKGKNEKGNLGMGKMSIKLGARRGKIELGEGNEDTGIREMECGPTAIQNPHIKIVILNKIS